MKRNLKAGTSNEVLTPNGEPPKKSKEEIQAAVDALVFKHGIKFFDWPDYADRLAEGGLKPEDIDALTIRTAERNFRERLKHEAHYGTNHLKWNTNPVVETTDTSRWTIWRTVCRRYYVVKSESLFEGEDAFPTIFRAGFTKIVRDKHGFESPMQDVLPKDFKSMRAALEAIEQHHREKVVGDDFKTNSASLLGDADATTTKKEVRVSTTVAEKPVVKIKGSAARRLFKALGQADAGTWPTKKIRSKINNITEVLKDANELKDGDDLALLKQISKALEDGHEIVIVGKPKVVANGKPAPKKAATDNGSGKDKFGARLGTMTAKINAALSGKAKTMKELMDEVGTKETFYNHLAKLIKEKQVIKTDDGYKLAK